MTAIALTIAGSDSGGGAGIQADLKSFSALGVYGASVITAVTAQNTRGVTAIEEISARMIVAQMDAVYGDLAVGATKIGMVSRVEAIVAIADRLSRYQVRPVLDPVMVATSGDRLIQPDAVEALGTVLVPRAGLVTPNLPEAALLTGRPVATDEGEMMKQAEIILAAGADAVMLKGGHGNGPMSTDLLIDAHGLTRLPRPRIETPNTHGTGCTLAAAITAGLARGLPLAEAAAEGRDYLHAAIEAGKGLSVGSGRGPVHHFHRWWGQTA